MGQSLELESVKTSGRTFPLVLWCESSDDPDATPRRFLVKSPGQPEVLEANLFAESLGNLLARDFGIPTPQPALVLLSDALVREIQPRMPGAFRLRGGMGTGCEFLPELKPLASDWRSNLSQRPTAALIYAFDLWVANFDRRIGKPNCGLLRGDYLAFDFECCFSFLQSLAAFSPKPWEVSQLGIAKHHIFTANSL